MVTIISSIGVLAISSEWGDNSCWGSQPVYPDCSYIFWLIFWLILALIGAGMVVFGLGVRLPNKKPRVARTAAHVPGFESLRALVLDSNQNGNAL